MVFKKINLHSGYHQLRVPESDIPKIAFSTRYEHFKFLVMSFDLTNATIAFLYLTNAYVSRISMNLSYFFVCDVLIYSKTKKEHEVPSRLILEFLLKETGYAIYSEYEIRLREVCFSWSRCEQ